MERKFSQQLRSFQELFLGEAKVDKGTNLLMPTKCLCHSQENGFIASLPAYVFRTLAHSLIDSTAGM